MSDRKICVLMLSDIIKFCAKLSVSCIIKSIESLELFELLLGPLFYDVILKMPFLDHPSMHVITVIIFI